MLLHDRGHLAGFRKRAIRQSLTEGGADMCVCEGMGGKENVVNNLHVEHNAHATKLAKAKKAGDVHNVKKANFHLSRTEKKLAKLTL